MFGKPFQKGTNREVVLSTGFKSEAIMWPGKEILYLFNQFDTDVTFFAISKNPRKSEKLGKN
jgi:hypothetical protein